MAAAINRVEETHTEQVPAKSDHLWQDEQVGIPLRAQCYGEKAESVVFTHEVIRT